MTRHDPEGTGSAAPPDVSVIMPVYNAERYLEEAVDSILRQSHANFEFLVLDDGSSDRSPEIMAGYAGRDRRIRFWSRPNAGICHTLNELIAAARAPLLARMDADDIAMPDRLEAQIAFMADHPQTVLLGGWMHIVDDQSRKIGISKPWAEHAVLDERHLRGLVMIGHPTAMMRRADVIAVSGYDDACRYAEDLDLWLKLAERGHIANLQQVVLSYRMTETSLSATKAVAQAQANDRACRQAWHRRGIADGTNDYTVWRPDSAAERSRSKVRYAWFMWNNGDLDGARHYARQAVWDNPLARAAWHALVFTHLRRPGPALSEQRG